MLISAVHPEMYSRLRCAALNGSIMLMNDSLNELMSDMQNYVCTVSIRQCGVDTKE